MKKFFAILLALALLLTLFACSKKETENKNVADDYLSQAKDLIAQEKYPEAYEILCAHKTDAEAAALLENFVWKNTAVYCTNSADSYYDYIDIYTYGADGMLTKHARTGANGSDSAEKYTYEGDRIKTITTDGKSQEYTYDPAGNVVKTVTSTPDGTVTDVFTYDAAGNLLKRVSSTPDGTCTDVFTYDASHRVTQEIYTDEDGDVYTDTYTYDANGHKTQEMNTYPDGETEKYEYTYDEHGNPIRQIYTDMRAEVETTTWIYTYDANGRMTQRNRTDAICTQECTYDTAGNLTKERVTYPDGGVTQMDCTYDPAGRKTQEVYKEVAPSDSILLADYTKQWNYDAEGNLTKTILTYSNGTIITTEYAYQVFYITKKETAR